MSTNVNPIGVATGYQHGKCFARKYKDCSTKISKEHFISNTLLQQIELNKTAKIAGLKWQEPKTFDIIPIKGLASKVLCERHNNALGPLDQEIGALAKTIQQFDKSTHPTKGDNTSELKIVSGIDIEHWMLKCLLGMTSSGNIKTKTMKPECLDLLFEKLNWEKDWGLYFNTNIKIFHSDSFLFEIRINPKTKLLLAANIFIRGFPFTLVLGKPGNPKSFGEWRPAKIIFENSHCKKEIRFDWEHYQHGGTVHLTRQGTYDGPPPDWKEWEQNG